MRIRAVLVSFALAGGGLLAVPQAASAAPLSKATLTATAAGPESGASDATIAVITVKIVVSEASAEVAGLEGGEIPGRVTDVEVDGNPAAPSTYDAIAEQNPERTAFGARLGTGANAATGGSLDVGTHTVEITTDLSKRSGNLPTVKFRLTSITIAGPVDANATIPLPDVTVSVPKQPGLGPDLAVTPTGTTYFVAQVGRRGADVAASTLTLTVPAGLTLDPDEGVTRFSEDNEDDFDSLDCRKASQTTYTCSFGKIDSTSYVAVVLEGDGTAKTGTSGTLGLSVVAANGLDAKPADNSVTTTVRFVPPAELRTKVEAADTSVELGEKTEVTVTVTNDGSEPASAIVPLFVTDPGADGDDEGDEGDEDEADKDTAFEITGFTGRENDLATSLIGTGGGTVGIEQALLPALARPRAGAASSPAPGITAAAAPSSAAPTATDDPDDEDFDDSDDEDFDDSDDEDEAYEAAHFRLWTPGTIAPGATVSAVLTVEAKRAGTADVNSLAVSTSGPSTCVTAAENKDDARDCREFDTVTLRAVASAAPSSGAIADTGARTGQLSALGVALLLLGGLSLYAGRRRVRS